MLKAIGLAQFAMFFVVFAMPAMGYTASRIFALNALNDGKGMAAEGWIYAFAGAVLTVAMCEIYKVLVKKQAKEFQEKLAAEQKAEEDARIALSKKRPSSV